MSKGGCADYAIIIQYFIGKVNNIRCSFDTILSMMEGFFEYVENTDNACIETRFIIRYTHILNVNGFKMAYDTVIFKIVGKGLHEGYTR